MNATGAFNASVPTIFSRSPANFSFPANLDVQMDTTGNFLPLVITSMDATVSDLKTGYQVGSGSLGRQTYAAKQHPIISLPLNFTYVGYNQSDPTCMFSHLCIMSWFSTFLYQGSIGTMLAETRSFTLPTATDHVSLELLLPAR